MQLNSYLCFYVHHFRKSSVFKRMTWNLFGFVGTKDLKKNIIGQYQVHFTESNRRKFPLVPHDQIIPGPRIEYRDPTRSQDQVLVQGTSRSQDLFRAHCFSMDDFSSFRVLLFSPSYSSLVLVQSYDILVLRLVLVRTYNFHCSFKICSVCEKRKKSHTKMGINPKIVKKQIY